MIDWEGIARQHGPLVWRTVFRLLGRGGTDAADCFQETFLTALDYARTREIHNWPGLLQRIATTRALDVIARRKAESGRRGGGLNDVNQVPSRRVGPEALAQETELMDAFREALAELPEAYREAFCLRHFSGMSYEEIAAETGATAQGVGVTLHRAKARLKRLLTAAGVADEQGRHVAPAPAQPVQGA
jgi:RNA polymerase sigma-70 factor (ECF subfamily)